MKQIRTGIIAIVMTMGIQLQSTAQDTPDKTKISVEIDPATFVFKGYSLHLRLQPKGSQHLFAGLGTYAMDMPNALVNLNKNNKDKDWKVRINQGYSLLGEYHFQEVNRKLFVGSQIGVQQFKIEQEEKTGHSKFSNLLAMGYFGYTFKPFGEHLYLKPWGGIGYTSKIIGTNKLENAVYDIAPITIFATLHVGYTF